MEICNGVGRVRATLLCFTALAAVFGANAAWAQSGGGSPGGSPTEQPSPPSSSQGVSAPAAGQAGSPQVSNTAAPPSPTARTDQGNAVQEIVVTAQKRAQNLQDVPISVTAVTAATLQAERISAVTDLGSVTPNLTVRNSAGGAGLPAFSMRGITSYGVVPGSDKEISIYLDGVYLGNTFGSTFDIPDIERIEVLHGPQGTLFGRNATAGAVSIITPDPPHKFGFHQEASFGNYAERRTKTRVDTGDFGPFSMTLSYVHDERNGDVKNTGAGTVWHYPAGTPFEPQTQVSPKYLGSKDANEYFGALRFQPTSKFKAIYKFDYTENHFTPEANVTVGTNTAYLGAAAGPILDTILATNPAYPLDANAKRPDSVNNSFTTPGYSRNYGHNLTATYQITDNLSIKNIASYRTSFIYSNDQLDGYGGLSITPATIAALGPLGGLFARNVNAPFSLFTISTQNRSNQWSDEAQVNYDTRYLTLTLGGLYFHQNAASGAPPGIPNNYALNVFPGDAIPGLSELGFGAAPGPSTSYNRQSSTAGYVQAEVHVLPKLDVVGGYRTTTDNKSGSYFFGGPAPLSFVYDKTKPSYLIGINYKPERDLLLYTKYSTAFVSGGAIGPAAFAPETVESYEGGLKGDFFRHRVQTDLAVFSARYANLQSAQSGQNVGLPQIGTAIIDLGGEKARGFEFQGAAIPIRNVTLGLGMGYTDFHYTSINPILGTLQTYLPTLEPKWTVDPSASYVTDPLFGDARLNMRLDANWRSRERLNANNIPSDLAAFPGLTENPSAWELNARIALERIAVLHGTAQVALWGKNLTQDRSPSFADDFRFVAATSFVPARTYGVDLIYDY